MSDLAPDNDIAALHALIHKQNRTVAWLIAHDLTDAEARLLV